MERSLVHTSPPWLFLLTTTRLYPKPTFNLFLSYLGSEEHTSHSPTINRPALHGDSVLHPELNFKMASEEHDATVFNVTAEPSDGHFCAMDNATTQKQEPADTPGGDAMDVEIDHIDEKRAQLSLSSDTPNAITTLPKSEDLEQQIQHLRTMAESCKQLADSYHFRLNSAKAARDKMNHRLARVVRERNDLRAELNYHQEDTATIIKQLRMPWHRFLQVYNDMRLPMDERLHEGSLEMLLAQVLDAKLQQVVERAARERNGGSANGHNDNDNSNNAIMLQLPIRELAGLSLGNGDDTKHKNGAEQTDVVNGGSTEACEMKEEEEKE
ncbi:hypothetical protein F4775DRAFT_187730 [Biscogniauxia sp. FL1348]|nr:hypothetical protein F4775DRAFT_187730 [Biscogniauxia sp. FL1348]